MEHSHDVWIVVDKSTGNPLEGMVTETMSPYLRDFYNRSKTLRVVQGKLIFDYPNARGGTPPQTPNK